MHNRHRSTLGVRRPSARLRRLCLILTVLAAELGILPPLGTAAPPVTAAPASAPSDTPFIYLPVVYGPAAPKSSFELIEEALRAGELDAETALIYRVYAITLDPRLPARYRGVDKDDLENDALREVVRRWDSLSAGTQALLAPFLVPPIYAGSWVDPATASRVADAPMADALETTNCYGPVPLPGLLPGWERLTTAHVTVWYQTAGDIAPGYGELATPEQTAATAQAAASVIEHIIGQETGLMEQWPLLDTNEPCNGGDGSIDIYITRRNLKMGAQTVPYPPGEVERPGYLWLAPDYADGDVKTVRDALAHEFFHLISLSYPQARTESNLGLPEYAWLDEATANWMVDYVYKDDQFEHEAAGDYLQPPYAQPDHWAPLELALQPGVNGYEDYVYLQFLDLRLGPQVMRAIWDATPTHDSLAAINEATKAAGGFETLWPEFALVAWNDWHNGFLDDLYVWDRLEPGMSQETYYPGPQPVALGGKRGDEQQTFSWVSGISHVSIGMSRHVFEDPTVRSVLFTNTLVGVRGAHVWALLKIGGEWTVEDWTDKRQTQFCRQVASERLEELVLLVTNSVFDDRAYSITAPEGRSLPTLTYSNIACGEWQGTVRTTRRRANEAFEHWETTETSVTFVPAPERTNPAQAGTMTWKVKGGSTTHWSGYESYNGCQTAKQVDVPIPVDLAGLSVVVVTSDLDFLGRYIGTGVVQHEQQMDFVCPWGSGGSATWYLTNEWWPYPQSGEFGVVSPDGRVIIGGLEQIDGNYTVTATWRLEAVGP
jgi:hypothetical protein